MRLRWDPRKSAAAAFCAALLCVAAPGSAPAESLAIGGNCPPLVLWSDIYDNAGSGEQDNARAVAVAPDGDIVAAGTEHGYNWLVRRLAPDGSLRWQKTYNDESGFDTANGVAVGPDGRTWVVGTGDHWLSGKGKSWVIRVFDAAGTMIWTTVYDSPGSNDDEALGVAVDRNTNEAVVVGYEDRPDLVQRANWRVNRYSLIGSVGTMRWSFSYDSPAHSQDIAYAVAIDTAGDAVVAGYEHRWDLGTFDDWLIRKYDPAGNLAWSSRYAYGAGAADYNDQARAVAVDASGRVFAGGYRGGCCGSNSMENGSWVIASWNSGGVFQNSTVSPAPMGAGSISSIHGLAVDSRGGVIAAGSVEMVTENQAQDWMVCRYEPDLFRCHWYYMLTGAPGQQTTDVAYGVALNAADDVFVAGQLEAVPYVWDYQWRIQAYAHRYACVDELMGSSDGIVFPNPVTGDTATVAVRTASDMKSATVDVYNSARHRVYHGEWGHVSALDASQFTLSGLGRWAPGVYTIMVRTTPIGGGADRVVTGITMVIKR